MAAHECEPVFGRQRIHAVTGFTTFAFAAFAFSGIGRALAFPFARIGCGVTGLADGCGLSLSSFSLTAFATACCERG